MVHIRTHIRKSRELESPGAELAGEETREEVDPKVAAELAVQAPLAPSQLTKLDKYQGRRMSIDRHQEMSKKVVSQYVEWFVVE